MSSHFYLFCTSWKNRFKELLRKPGKLALYLLVLAGIGIALATTLTGAVYVEHPAPVAYVSPIYFAFLLLFYSISVKKGLASGDAIFEMSDVNFLFVSPANPRATLLYGLIRMIGMSFWAGFFLLFQSSALANFGVGFDGVLILFGTFILNMVALTILSLVIYSTTNGKPGRKRTVRILAVLVFVPLLVFSAVQFMTNSNMLMALGAIIDSPILAATPFVGWATAGAIALIEGNLATGFSWLGLLILTAAGMFLYIMLSRSDYYEDVLVATETSFEKKRAAAEGDVQAAGSTESKVRVTKTGLNGIGAKVFVYKHLRETFRKNRFGFLSMQILITAVIILGLSVFLRGKVELLLVLQVLMWMQVFLIGTGRGLMEIYSHYIYMIPASPFKKLIWSNMEMILRTLVESILFFAIPGLVLGSHLLIIIGSMIVYILFSLMLLGVNYLSLRWTEANISQGILLMVYFLIVLLFIAPGLIVAIAVSSYVEGLAGTFAALLILSVWELIVAVICFKLSKNILHNCDMPNMKK